MTAVKIFAEGSYSQKDIDDFRAKNPGVKVKELYDQQLAELFQIQHPNITSGMAPKTYQKFLSSKGGPARGSWVFYPWSNQLLHILNEVDYFALRTNRNQYLISEDEQRKMQEYDVGVAGLSVGNSIATALSYSATCGSIRLADIDNFSTSNLNRVRIVTGDIDQSKLDVTARQIYEANPYAKLKVFTKGISSQNLSEFVTSGKYIVFDEIDDFEMKVRLRLEAQKRRVPVVMLTNLGDNVLIDIERYDLDSKLAPFNGAAQEVVEDILSGGQISEENKKRYAVQIVGIEHVPTRALESVRDIGRTLVGRPQLYTSVSISGGLAAYIVRQLALGHSLPTGRYFHSLADVFKQPRFDLQLTDKRRQILRAIKYKPPLKNKYTQPPQLIPADFFSEPGHKDKIACLLEYAILAPSTHNTQPWKLKIESSSCKIFIDHSRRLPAADKLQRDMYISLGALLKNLEAAAVAFGVYSKTDIADQSGELVGEVFFTNLDKASAANSNTEGLSAILTRSNYRGPFVPLPISDELRDFISGKSSSRLKLNLIEDRKQIEELARITAQGLKLAYSKPAFRQEIASWIVPSGSRRKTGIPGYALRMPVISSHIIPRLIRVKDIGPKLAKLNYQSFVTASAVVVLSADKEEPKIWLEAGQIAQEIFLRLESEKAAASIYVAAVEMGNLNQSVKRVAGIKGKPSPQFLFCIGKPLWPKVYTPREALKHKLIS